jgi:dethiobiotin synthetase
VRDLARELDLPVVIAALPGLGTINHSLMTIEAVRAVGMEPAAVVLTPWPADPSPVEPSNVETIRDLGQVRVERLRALDLDDPESWPSLEDMPWIEASLRSRE